jgi:7-cyano-7-deazaguanine synthase
MDSHAVVLLSGGLDSATALAWAIKQGWTVHALSFHYDQNHSIEVERAQLIAREVECEHLIIDLDFPFVSALTRGGIDTLDVPKDGIQAGIPVTYVPARNTIFLSYALAWAEELGASAIVIGVNAVDYSGYPDCRPEYIRAFQLMADLATKAGVEGRGVTIHAPLQDLTKGQIIQLGTSLGVEYEMTFSCYDPVRQRKRYIPCGKCDSCRWRAKGFAEVGVPDPALP